MINTAGCPQCGCKKSSVTNSRPWHGKFFRVQWRKRKCHICGFVAQTVEIPIELLNKVVNTEFANTPESRKNR